MTTGITDLSGPSAVNTGICTLTYQGNTFRFRTNPNEIWWSYELLQNVEETLGGRVIQILGTRLGDLEVKVDCGRGGIPYLMEVVYYLRNLLSDQRNGNPATFEYSTRGWRLNVFAMSIPFQDQFDATVREIPLNFKIQEDITGQMSQVTMDAALAGLQDGVYPPGMPTHNQYNDAAGVFGGLAAAVGAGGTLTGGLTDPLSPGGPTYLPPNTSANKVDMQPLGDFNLGGLGGLGGLLGFLGGI